MFSRGRRFASTIAVGIAVLALLTSLRLHGDLGWFLAFCFAAVVAAALLFKPSDR